LASPLPAHPPRFTRDITRTAVCCLNKLRLEQIRGARRHDPQTIAHEKIAVPDKRIKGPVAGVSHRFLPACTGSCHFNLLKNSFATPKLWLAV
jgi:hypothetical protein